MPIPAAAEGDGAKGVVLALFLQLHRQLRDVVSGLDADALNWVPTPGANSIATIITHVVGSEAETLRSLAGLACDRDREAEFEVRESTRDQVLELLDEADDLIAAVTALIGVERLESGLTLPTLPVDEARLGLTWLVGNYGHAKEHLGHVELTRQLYEVQGATASGQNSAPGVNRRAGA
jgi:DinB superfamily